MSITIAIKY